MRAETAIRHREAPLDGGRLPVVWEITEGRDAGLEEIRAWLGREKPGIESVLNRSGALLLRGFSRLRSAADFEAAITAICPHLRDYLGGTSPRTVVRGKIMTATYTPPSWSIPLHQEMAYTRNPPDRIAFFCVRPGSEGGESTLGDMTEATRRIPPDIMRRLKAHGWRLRRTLTTEEKSREKSGIQKPWSEVFSTGDRAEAERIAAAKGWRVEWLDRDTMQLWQEVLPATRVHPVSGAEVWFNQVHFFSPAGMTGWARRDGRTEDYERLVRERRERPELVDEVFYGDGTRVSDEDAERIIGVLREAEVKVRLEPSDLLILDNLLVAHGRTPFRGEREILVALINVPEWTHER